MYVDYYLYLLFIRVASRATVINFKLPPVAPVTCEEEEVFIELEQLISSGTLSSSIGWAIAQGKALLSQQGRDEVLEIKEKLRGIYHGRSLQNWALLMFFLKRVRCHVLTCITCL